LIKYFRFLQRWVWENKKTHLKQAGIYAIRKKGEDEEDEEPEEEEEEEGAGPPGPKAPHWKGLQWSPDGMTYED
jgi:hypothetical protein